MGKLQVQPQLAQPSTGWAMHSASMPSSGTVQAPSHPAQKGPWTTKFPHAGQPGHGANAKLPRWEEAESREGGRRDVIHDKANPFPLLSSPPTSPAENDWGKKRLNRIEKTESTWEQAFAAPSGVNCDWTDPTTLAQGQPDCPSVGTRKWQVISKVGSFLS